MRIGVENFDRHRLAQALSYRLRTKDAVAKATGTTVPTLTSYLNGKRKPSPESLDRIATFLGLPKRFFTKRTDLDGYNDALKQWRSYASKKKADTVKGEVILSWIIEAHSRFDEVFELPKFTLGNQADEWGIPSDISKITIDVVEDVAARVRDLWGLGKLPIRNLLRAAERAGIVVGRYNLNVQQLDAVSTCYNGRAYVLLNSFKQSACRARFDLAHEIGHLVLHRGVAAEDLAGSSGKGIYKKLEEQAHWFAGALLLPADRFAADFWAPTFQCFVDLKEKWKVSIQAMIRRGLTLSLITESQYNWLNIAISKKNARQVEPLDDAIPLERIRLFSKGFERYEEDFGIAAMPDLIDELSLPVDILTQLLEVDPAQVDRFLAGGQVIGDNLLHHDFRRRQT